MAKHLKEPTLETAPAYTYQPESDEDLYALEQVESIPVVESSSEPVAVPVSFEIPELEPLDPNDDTEVVDRYASTSPGVLGFGASTSPRRQEARPSPTRSGRERYDRTKFFETWSAEMEANEIKRNTQDALAARALQSQGIATLHTATPPKAGTVYEPR